MIYALCPHCHTVARVQAARLNAGEIHCDRCGQDYAPLGQLYDDALEAQAAALAQTRAEAATPPAEIPVTAPAAPAPEPEPQPEETRAEAPPPAAAEPLEAEPLARPARDVTGADWDAFGQPPREGDIAASVDSRRDLDSRVKRQIEEALLAELAEPRRPRVAARTWLGLGAALLLLLALAGQWIYTQRDAWLDHPQWRPWADRACELLGCELPLRRDPRQIELLEREVRDHPRLPETVLIRASFTNRADFTQPYPVFEVTFSDLSDRPLAVHRFGPEEYLEDPAGIPVGLAAGQTARVRLEVPDPGRQAVSFRMEFR